MARLRGFAKATTIGECTAGVAAIEMWCPVFSVMRIVTSSGRDSGDRDLGREVAVFSILISSNTASLRRRSPSLFLYGLGWRLFGKGRGSEKGAVVVIVVIVVGASGRHGPRNGLRRKIGF